MLPPVLRVRKRKTSGTHQSGEEGQKRTGRLRQLALESLMPKTCEPIRLQKYIKTLHLFRNVHHVKGKWL